MSDAALPGSDDSQTRDDDSLTGRYLFISSIRPASAANGGAAVTGRRFFLSEVVSISIMSSSNDSPTDDRKDEVAPEEAWGMMLRACATECMRCAGRLKRLRTSNVCAPRATQHGATDGSCLQRLRARVQRRVAASACASTKRTATAAATTRPATGMRRASPDKNVDLTGGRVFVDLARDENAAAGGCAQRRACDGRRVLLGGGACHAGNHENCRSRRTVTLGAQRPAAWRGMGCLTASPPAHVELSGVLPNIVPEGERVSPQVDLTPWTGTPRGRWHR